MNNVIISGKVATPLMIDHEYEHESFYQFILEVQRASGTPDFIPVIISYRLIDNTKDKVGKYVTIKGQFRSFNSKDESKIHLLLYIFPIEIEFTDDLYYRNEIELCGTICKKPIIRGTPQGRTITDVMLAVNRLYDKSDYIPCIAWGRNAHYVSNMDVGTEIVISGRIQSREYLKNNQVKTAYEVSIIEIGMP